MWVRKRIDIGWSDLAYGVFLACLAEDRLETQRCVERHWSADGDALACLSVRSGFDLLLKALDWPHASEVLFSAVTIHDMVRIVEHHGLTAVPVDLDVRRLAPKSEALRRAITPATRAIVVAHLFGGRVDLDPVIEVAREHGLLVIEDCAQAFMGEQYLGHPRADVSLFSFGPIKTNTALGGAVLRIHDAALRERMVTAQQQYPVQGRFTYVRRVLKYAAVKAMSSRLFLGTVARGCRLLGTNHDRIANNMVRGFAGPRFFERIRRQPSAPLLSLLRRRLANFDGERLARRAGHGQLLSDRLDVSVSRPGAASLAHTHWVFPILTDNPPRLLDRLWRAGFDATQGQSLCIVDAPAGRAELAATDARAMLEKTVFLPLYPDLPVRSLLQMADVVLDECQASRDVAPEPVRVPAPRVVGEPANTKSVA